MANKAAGKGYENESFYADIKFQFLGIENIHVMRSSLQKLLECKFAEIYYLPCYPNYLPSLGKIGPGAGRKVCCLLIILGLLN